MITGYNESHSGARCITDTWSRLWCVQGSYLKSKWHDWLIMVTQWISHDPAPPGLPCLASTFSWWWLIGLSPEMQEMFLSNQTNQTNPSEISSHVTQWWMWLHWFCCVEILRAPSSFSFWSCPLAPPTNWLKFNVSVMVRRHFPHCVHEGFELVSRVVFLLWVQTEQLVNRVVYLSHVTRVV